MSTRLLDLASAGQGLPGRPLRDFDAHVRIDDSTVTRIAPRLGGIEQLEVEVAEQLPQAMTGQQVRPVNNIRSSCILYAPSVPTYPQVPNLPRHISYAADLEQ